ncbi:MAG TPA: MEDS domain-containing protein [Conexivisphaerales archaeon]|nr:MEDS domain-containing protein [Conexivisphaerales archaeon]
MSNKVLFFPKSENIREQVAASVDASLAEAMGELAWPALRKQLASLYGLSPEDLVYNHDRFVESVGHLLGVNAAVILYPLVLAHLKVTFPQALSSVESLDEAPGKLEEIDGSLKVQMVVMEKMKLGEHVMVLYDNLEMKEQVIQWFYKGAVEKDFMFSLIAGSPDRSNITGDLSSRGLPVNVDSKRTSLLSVRESFFDNYVFSPQKAVDKLRQLVRDAKERGYKGVRVVIDNGGLLRYGEEVGVAQLERALGAKLPFSAHVMCTYDKRHFGSKEKLRQMLIDSHGLVILPEGFQLVFVDYGPPGQRRL